MVRLLTNGNLCCDLTLESSSYNSIGISCSNMNENLNLKITSIDVMNDFAPADTVDAHIYTHNISRNSHKELFEKIAEKDEAQDILISQKADITSVPTKLSEIENDCLFKDLKADIDFSNISLEAQSKFDEKLDLDASNISSTGKETIVGWGMPDYENVIEGTMPSLGSWVQCVKDSFVCCYGGDSYIEDYWCYVSPDNGTTTYVVGRRYDDVNANTQHTSFTFFVPKGWYFKITSELVPHYYIYPLKGVSV